jgi:hypothetical protein
MFGLYLGYLQMLGRTGFDSLGFILGKLVILPSKVLPEAELILAYDYITTKYLLQKSVYQKLFIRKALG